MPPPLCDTKKVGGDRPMRSRPVWWTKIFCRPYPVRSGKG
uniref:Uncharacterized protein n=1 Tax=Siphoviridae sp. ct91l7 TaxID=2826173 RepID=A0A8S5MWM6_9CAUD|nr:MAG TPA: hypothetical protein [Siphoviridae sp. ct91l7]